MLKLKKRCLSKNENKINKDYWLANKNVVTYGYIYIINSSVQTLFMS